MKKSIRFLDRDSLKILAMALMLCDHLWATVIPGNDWLTLIGRIAFPIFAFQAAEGYVYTSSFRTYALRLLFWALISEIPFNLMYSSAWFDPFHQNVMFTLLLGLLLCRQLDKLAAPHVPAKKRVGTVALLLLLLLVSFIGFVDYGFRGVLTVVVFYVFRPRPEASSPVTVFFSKTSWLWRAVSLLCLFVFFFEGRTYPVSLFGHIFDFPQEGLAVLALVPIALYNGKKGHGGRPMQIIGYVFYPAHMLLLHLIRLFFI